MHTLVLKKRKNKRCHRRRDSRDAGRQHLRHVLSVKVHNGGDEVVLHYEAAQRLPLEVLLAEQRARRLDRQFDGWRRVGQRPHLHQVLLLDALDR